MKKKTIHRIVSQKLQTDYLNVAYKIYTAHLRSDDRLTLETSALESLRDGQITLSILFIKPNTAVFGINTYTLDIPVVL